ncbi:hypothetical protein B0H14DRAFT_2606992 [Mycena olivaceomarginata]|nr:hypothetical protein B0H14DRAFT_2606992 [Mycena olivaceomarginata]
MFDALNTEISFEEPTDAPSTDSIHPVASTSAAPPLSNDATMGDVFDPDSAARFSAPASPPRLPPIPISPSPPPVPLVAPPAAKPLSRKRKNDIDGLDLQTTCLKGSHGPEYESDPHNSKFKSVVLIVDGQLKHVSHLVYPAVLASFPHAAPNGQLPVQIIAISLKLWVTVANRAP